MTLLAVQHTTTYRYKQPVAFGEHRVMFRPRDSFNQRLSEARSSFSFDHPILGELAALSTGFNQLAPQPWLGARLHRRQPSATLDAAFTTAT